MQQSGLAPHVHAPKTVNGQPVTYDFLGDLLGFGTRAYTYDLYGRLTTVKDSAKLEATYAYDATGRRVSVVDTSGPRPTATRRFVRDDFEWDASRKLGKIHIALGGAVVATQVDAFSPVISAVPPGAPLDRPWALGSALAPAALAALLLRRSSL